MHTVELFEQLVQTAQRLGYQVRQEYLGGIGGGQCEVAGKKSIFIDLALNSAEQLDQLIEALQEDPAIYTLSLSEEVVRVVHDRKAA
jgi:hypothetical protein